MWQAGSGMRGLALKNACLDRLEVEAKRVASLGVAAVG
jgi:hypothetical protein